MPQAPQIIHDLVATFANDARIDRLLYKLYALTGEEFRILEETTA